MELQMPSLTVSLSAVCLLAWIISMFLSKFIRKRRSTDAPYVPGHFIFGNGKQFNENAVDFLHKCEREHGDIFTIRLMHTYMTIIADPHSISSFGREANFDFDPIQKQVNGNVFGFEVPHSRKMIAAVSNTVKGVSLQNSMTRFSMLLEDTFTQVDGGIGAHGGSKVGGLKALACQTIFQSIFKEIYGQENMNNHFNYREFADNFHIFHEYFNYLWLGLPHFLFPTATKSAQKLMMQPSVDRLQQSEGVSDYLQTAMDYMREHDKSDSDIHSHNLVYLHVNFNTYKVAFWCMYYILEHPEALEALRTEIQHTVEEKAKGSHGSVTSLTLDDVEGMKVLDSIVKETVRLASGVFMVRAVTRDTNFTTSSGKTVTVREGDKVAIYPPAFHKDPTVFEDPLEYKYDRFVDQTIYKNGKKVANPVLPFGTLCPGKRMATGQIKWYLVALFNEFDIELLPGQSTELDVQYHGHEILPPTNEVKVRYSRRPSSAKVDFEPVQKPGPVQKTTR